MASLAFPPPPLPDPRIDRATAHRIKQGALSTLHMLRSFKSSSSSSSRGSSPSSGGGSSGGGSSSGGSSSSMGLQQQVRTTLERGSPQATQGAAAGTGRASSADFLTPMQQAAVASLPDPDPGLDVDSDLDSMGVPEEEDGEVEGEGMDEDEEGGSDSDPGGGRASTSSWPAAAEGRRMVGGSSSSSSGGGAITEAFSSALQLQEQREGLLGALVSVAYPDRIAVRKDTGRERTSFMLSTGRGCREGQGGGCAGGGAHHSCTMPKRGHHMPFMINTFVCGGGACT